MKRARSAATAAAIVVGLVAMAGCSAGGGGQSGQPSTDPDAPIVVWTDATRQPVFEAFAAKNPDLDVDIELVQPDYLSKLQLFNKTGKGWPDVIFAGNTNDIARLASKPLDYAQPLDDEIDTKLRDEFGSANKPCEIDGALYCLRNDVAPTVLWYNSTLMDEYGYSVPTTWQEYGELGDRVAKEHPGLVLGTAGDVFAYFSFFQAAGCPMQDVTGAEKVHIDLGASECTELATILDGMIKNGTLLTSGAFDPETKAVSDKILMMPGPNWFGQFLFEPEGSFNYPAGQLTAAAPPALGDDDAYSGSGGGGIFVISRHTKNFDAALAAATFATTDIDEQAKAPTYPAYAPAADAWRETLAASTFFSKDPFDAMQGQVDKINPVNDHSTRYEPTKAYSDIIVQGIRSGSTISELLPDFEKRLVDLAKSEGYTVE